MNFLDYSTLLDQFDSLRNAPVFDAEWPKTARGLSLAQALQSAHKSNDANELNRCADATRAQLKMLGHPIIAVLGQLNAGKSSVVASFVSPAGRRRISRGVEGDKGTHRFVYWVPASWLADDHQSTAFFAVLHAVHGPQYEHLSDVPETAATQYGSGLNNPAKLQIPLIAGDPALDKLGAAFLDCPDVQTHDTGTALGAVENHRLEMLVQATQICSALLVVWLRQMVRDGLLERILKDVRRRVPTAPLFLLLNKIDPEENQPTRTRNDTNVATLLKEFQIPNENFFAAFNFRVEAYGTTPGWRELTPPTLVERFSQPEGKDFPQFFQADPDPILNRPADIAQERFLINLPRRLDPAELQSGKMADAWNRLQSFTLQCVQTIRDDQRAQLQLANEMHAGLLQMCVEQFRDPVTGDGMQALSPEFTIGFEKSIRRTAPRWVRWTIDLAKPIQKAATTMSRKFSQIFKELPNLLKGKLPTKELWKTIMKPLTEAFPDQTLNHSDPTALAAAMKTQRWVPSEISETKLTEGWTAVLNNFRRHPLPIDGDELDRMTTDIWGALGLWQKLKFSASNFLIAISSLVVVAASLGVLIDGGVTMFTTFSFTTWLAAILPGKIMVAAAVAGGTTLGASLLLGSMKVNTLPYLAHLFALAADAFAIPRKVSSSPIEVTFGRKQNTRKYTMPSPNVPDQETTCILKDLQLWKETSNLQKIEELLQPQS